MTTRECGKAAGTSRKSGEWNEPDLYSLCHTGGLPRGSNANLGSEVFYRCIVVSLVSAKQKNQNCDAALVTNTAVPEPYAAQLSQAGIRVIACPFDNYRFEAI